MRSTRSVNMSKPTRSLLDVAAMDSTAASSAASSRLNRPRVPKSADALASTISITVSSRSSRYRRT